jgi:hypothetical protein
LIPRINYAYQAAEIFLKKAHSAIRLRQEPEQGVKVG